MKPILRDAVYARLRDRIIGGELAGGAALGEVQIAAEFDVSRVPVREAIQRLSDEGFVEYVPHKGARVVAAEPDLIREIFQIREGLECIAAREAAVRIGADRLAFLRSHFESLRPGIADGTLVDAGDSIHDELLTAAGNQRLVRLTSIYCGQISRFQRMASALPGQLVRAFREHDSILAALEAHDPDWAESAARAHIRNTLRELLAALPSTT